MHPIEKFQTKVKPGCLVRSTTGYLYLNSELKCKIKPGDILIFEEFNTCKWSLAAGNCRFEYKCKGYLCLRDKNGKLYNSVCSGPAMPFEIIECFSVLEDSFFELD